MLAKAGVDEIRLDEIGFPFRPCFNAHHHHKSPYDSHQWTREYLARIRKATDSINPDLVISTEFFMDYFNEYTNGALVMDCSGKEIDAMKVAMPNYLALSYHASSAEAAITGAILSKLESHRKNWAWAHVGTERPDNYPAGDGVQLPYHELYPSFAAAIQKSDITDKDPVSVNDDKWMGHIWKADQYWILTGGHDDASPLKQGQVEIMLPELPADFQHAYEFDLRTLQMQEIAIKRNEKGISIQMHNPVSLVFFPSPSCPPLPLIQIADKGKAAGQEKTVQVKLFSPWTDAGKKGRSTLKLTAPGFTVKKQKTKNSDDMFTVKIPAGTRPNNYYVSVEGNCLPAKKWFSVSGH